MRCQFGGVPRKIGRMARQPTLNVSLTPPLQKFVEQKVASGLYESASEVVRESLRMLERHEQGDSAWWDDVRAKIAEGKQAAADGDSVDGPKFMASMKRKLVRRAATNKKSGR